MSNNPSLFEGDTLHFNNQLYIALDVIIGITCLAAVISVGALGVQIARKDQRQLVKKTSRAEGTYFLPHSPVLAPVMVTIYCIVAIATEFVLKAFLWKGTALAVIQRLSLLLPMPLLLWAWLSAFSNAFAWHLTPPGSSRAMKIVRFKPMTLNLVCWIAPFVIFAIQLALTCVWPVLQARSSTKQKHLASLKQSLSADDPLVQAAQADVTYAKDKAESIYQAVWAFWTISYAACWLIYAIYSSLLLALLGHQLEFVDSMSANHRGRIQDLDTPGEKSLAESEGRRKSKASLVPAVLRRRSSCSDTSRALSRIALLRKNSRLVAMELASFSLFTLCWTALSLAKASLGYKILNDPKNGPITVVAELYLSTIFGLVIVTLMLFRGINILRNRGGDDIQVPSGSSSGSKEQTDATQRPPTTIAARRGRKGLSIPLNVGSYIVPPAMTTPDPALFTGTSYIQAPSSLSGTAFTDTEMSVTAKAPGEGGFFPSPTTLSPLTPTAPNVRRKSSVTFIDDLPSLIPPSTYLEDIAGSPVLPHLHSGTMEDLVKYV